MTKDDIQKSATDFLNEADCNYVQAEDALRRDLTGMRIFDNPLTGFAAAGDTYLRSLTSECGAGIELAAPTFWLDSAKTVISVFLPSTEQIRASNRKGTQPSDEWLHARIQGAACHTKLALHLKRYIEEHGFAAVIPVLDERFWVMEGSNDSSNPVFTSNWSERHVAFAAGLGTFSLSKGLITKKGVAGRFCSLVTSLELNPDPRPYTKLYEYCCNCGRCAVNCPAHAIDKISGKDHLRCGEFLQKIKAQHPPYYGCGKCQTAVPCESSIPIN